MAIRNVKAGQAYQTKTIHNINQTKTPEEWKQQLKTIVTNTRDDEALWQENLQWWKAFWSRSHIVINPDKGEDDEGWKIGRNYNIFRYMLVSGL